MPRITGPEARQEVTREMGARWKYVLRHPQFREDMRELRTMYGDRNALEVEPRHRDLVKNWGLTEVPFEIRTCPYIPDDLPHKNAYYESFAHAAPIGYPVQVEEMPQGFTTPSGFHRGRFVKITVDLTYPDYLLIPLVTEELRPLRGGGAQERHHRDKDDEYLEIYDRAERGESLRMVARAVGKNLSTVKSEFKVACDRIWGPDNAPPKLKLLFDGFDTEIHPANCSQCRQAFEKEDPSEEDFCPAWRAYLNQDRRGQRELTGLDTTRDVRDDN